jgi:hypothetical protein
MLKVLLYPSKHNLKQTLNIISKVFFFFSKFEQAYSIIPLTKVVLIDWSHVTLLELVAYINTSGRISRREREHGAHLKPEKKKKLKKKMKTQLLKLKS